MVCSAPLSLAPSEQSRLAAKPPANLASVGGHLESHPRPLDRIVSEINCEGKLVSEVKSFLFSFYYPHSTRQAVHRWEVLAVRELLGRENICPLPPQTLNGFILSLQDLPAAALPSSAMSRREFRKLHCIAKEEEEEEEDV